MSGLFKKNICKSDTYKAPVDVSLRATLTFLQSPLTLIRFQPFNHARASWDQNYVFRKLSSISTDIYCHHFSTAWTTFVEHSDNKGSGLTWPYWGSWKPMWSDGSFPSRGPITDLHSTKLRSLFSCHFHWVEGHSVSSIKWLGHSRD